MMAEATPRQLAADLLTTLSKGNTDPLWALEQVLPWLVRLGSSPRKRGHRIDPATRLPQGTLTS
ncbi:hypothetical protein [Arthrobacter sp.]|uniref:hypothetical protein n=1 Tax=Arthrobacter sp. TaxID=1667 RepID=UPI0033985F15